MTLKQVGPGQWEGDSNELLAIKDVRQILTRLKKLGIDLLCYDITFTKVYSQQTYAQPYGFDFKSPRMNDLVSIASHMSHRQHALSFDDFNDYEPAVFNEDDKTNTEGFISGGVTKGRGFRQIGGLSALHLELDAANDTGNIHVDSHGYVTGEGVYDWSRSGEHGYWDLGSYYLPSLYGKLGDGRVGPMVRPIRTPEGGTRWIIGLMGEF